MYVLSECALRIGYLCPRGPSRLPNGRAGPGFITRMLSDYIFISPFPLCCDSYSLSLSLIWVTHILTDKLRVDIFIKFIAISNYLYIYKIRFVSLEAIQSEKRTC